MDVIRAASRLIPERGIDGVSVPALMAEAGLTHGAFYGQFESQGGSGGRRAPGSL